MLDRFTWLVRGLVVRPERMRANLESTGGLFFSQRLLLALVVLDLPLQWGINLGYRDDAALVGALGGLDVLVFSGGVGENRPDVREAVAGRLRFLGDFRTEVVHAREDVMIARGVRTLLASR